MFARKKVVVVLEIKSESLRISCSYSMRSGLPEVVFKTSFLYSGYREGLLNEPDELFSIIRKLIRDAEKNIKTSIKHINVAIPCEFLCVASSDAGMSFSKPQKIKDEHIIGIKKLAIDKFLTDSTFVPIEVMPLIYEINKQAEQINPIGTNATSVLLKSNLLLAKRPLLILLEDILNELGIESTTYYPTPLALGEHLLKFPIINDIKIILYMDEYSTSIIFFELNSIVFMKSASIGIFNFIEDISKAYDIALDFSEYLLNKYDLSDKKISNSEIREIYNNEKCIYSQKQILEIINNNLLILESFILDSLKEASFVVDEVRHILVTGCGFNLRGLKNKLASHLKINMDYIVSTVENYNKLTDSVFISNVSYALQGS